MPHRPAGQAPGVRARHRLEVVEQPLVGPHRPVEPHRVIEAGAHPAAPGPPRLGLVRGPQRAPGRADRSAVGHVGEHAGVQRDVVGQLPVGPHPHGARRRRPRSGLELTRVDGPAVHPAARSVLVALEVLGIGHALERRRQLELAARLLLVERRIEVEDRLAVLEGDHAAGGEGRTVADPVDRVDDRQTGAPGAQEVGVQRVHPMIDLDGVRCRHEGLAGDLAPEHASAAVAGLARVRAPVQIAVDVLELQEAQQPVQPVAHAGFTASMFKRT